MRFDHEIPDHEIPAGNDEGPGSGNRGLAVLLVVRPKGFEPLAF